MIYLFDCCKNACSLPAKICEKCSEACRDNPCAKACSTCCSDLSNWFQGIVNRPMGGFVFMAVWVAILELGCCIYSLVNQSMLADCVFPQPQLGLGILNWLSVQMGFAALNMLFAPYVQWQLWRKLNEEAREKDDPDAACEPRTKLANTATGAVHASKQDVVEAFKHVFLYDIGVLLYFVALCASFYCSWYGSAQISTHEQECSGKIGGFPRYSAWIGMFFVVFVFLYGLAWYFSMYCMEHSDTLTLRRGLAVAATISAAAGRPIPGYAPPQAAANMTDRPPAGLFHMGGGSAQAGGRSDNKTNQVTSAGGNQSNDHCSTNYQPPPSKPSCAKSFGKLIVSIGLDMMGNATYLFPGVGEYGDAVFAPASAVMLKMMYNANGIALVGLCEELLPFTDIIPTATMAWFLQHCAPDHPFTRGVGISNHWELTGTAQR